MKDGRVLAEGPFPLPAASGNRTQHVGKLPIGGLPPGTYELMIRVASNGHELSRTAFFTLAGIVSLQSSVTVYGRTRSGVFTPLSTGSRYSRPFSQAEFVAGSL